MCQQLCFVSKCGRMRMVYCNSKMSVLKIGCLVGAGVRAGLLG